jgi:hypothetical protein
MFACAKHLHHLLLSLAPLVSVPVTIAEVDHAPQHAPLGPAAMGWMAACVTRPRIVQHDCWVNVQKRHHAGLAAARVLPLDSAALESAHSILLTLA